MYVCTDMYVMKYVQCIMYYIEKVILVLSECVDCVSKVILE